ncbi:MAG: inosine/xanthosine triphosphatase [Armatimonadota bacterium]|nr:inosine/xanthosine triphosphatase [Armatimonadota bacterium]MDR7451872.1 inosine/xanthosine triphosphatase [Armatimonadota bacterium]MDR7467597.1 inosine/xanthosine triphosphatase [Armatimonadota bacterium]MDR7494442.1 inosine/xanthosine triphosphatase [Armatimonadota bacterium]MDR7499703.1 inosine/xanthosine triphosphatase [Armatimonadota bacterium]
MRIVLGSTSPSKLRAVRAVCARAFPEAAVEALDVPAGVAPQPVGEEETIHGARQRACQARERTDADLGIGIEGGVFRDARGAWLCAWAVVVDRRGREGLASGVRVPLPEWIAGRALAGEELGAIVDAHLDEPEAHETLGAVGLLTRGLLDRQAALEQAVLAALAPFLSPSVYDGPAPASSAAHRG